MEPPNAGASRRREFARIPLPIRVHLEFREQRCFLSETVANISPGGMFVRSESPREPGDQFDFEARLTDRGPPLSGTGVVVWIHGHGDDQTPGMGTRFLELEPGSRELLLRLIDAHAVGGEEGLERELEELASAWEEKVSEGDSTVAEPAAPAPHLPETERDQPETERDQGQGAPMTISARDTSLRARSSADPSAPPGTTPGTDAVPATPDGAASDAPSHSGRSPIQDPPRGVVPDSRVGPASAAPGASPPVPEPLEAASRPTQEPVPQSQSPAPSTDSAIEPIPTDDLPLADDPLLVESLELEPVSRANELEAEPETAPSQLPEEAAEGASEAAVAESGEGLRWGRIATLSILGLLLLGAGLLWPEWFLPGDRSEWRVTNLEPTTRWRPEDAPISRPGESDGGASEPGISEARISEARISVAAERGDAAASGPTDAPPARPDSTSGTGRAGRAAVEAAGESPMPLAEPSPDPSLRDRTGAATRRLVTAGDRFAPGELRSIRALEGQPSEDGLLIRVLLDGPISTQRVRNLRLEDPLRVVLVLSGIAEAYMGELPEVDPSEVSGIRLGFHSSEAGPEQHIVFDLVDSAVTLETVRQISDGVELRLSRSPSLNP